MWHENYIEQLPHPTATFLMPPLSLVHGSVSYKDGKSLKWVGLDQNWLQQLKILLPKNLLHILLLRSNYSHTAAY